MTTEQVVNRWENGQHKPNRHFQTQLCQLFGKSAEELGFMDGSQTVEKEAELYDPSQLFRIDEATPEALENFAALTETCRLLSDGNELKTAERILWAYLPRVESIAQLSSDEYQHQAASIVSQSYLLAASLAGHRNNLLERLRFSQHALLYGELAKDLNLQLVALRQLSITFDYLDRPDKVLQTYRRTLPYLNEVSPLLRSCIYAGVAGAHAQLGHEQETLRFLGMAYDHFPEKPESEPGYLYTICRYSTLVFFDGLMHLDFKRPCEAEKIFARIDGLQPKIQLPEKARIELLNYQAETFIVLRNMEQACAYLEAAVQASKMLGSVIRFQEASTVFQQMQSIWHNEPRIQNLADLFMR